MKSLYPAVCFGEILWDVLPSGEEAGGAPMNVAYHLTRLGVHAILISRIGNDDRGKSLLAILQKNKLSTEQIQLDLNYETGVVYAKPGLNHEMTYEIVYPVAWDFIKWSEDLQALVAQSEFFIHGSLGARNEVSRETLFRLIEGVNKRIFDINIRPPHFNKELALRLMNGVYILKLNKAELGSISRWYGVYKTVDEQIKIVQDQLKVPFIVTTCGENGAMVNAEGVIYKHPGYKVLVADTVGSGDAFLAGFLYQVMQGESVQHALNFACASGAVVASYIGACPTYETSELKKLMI